MRASETQHEIRKWSGEKLNRHKKVYYNHSHITQELEAGRWGTWLGLRALPESTHCTEELWDANAWYASVYVHDMCANAACHADVYPIFGSCSSSPCRNDVPSAGIGCPEVYDDILKVKGLPPILNCLLIFPLLPQPFLWRLPVVFNYLKTHLAEVCYPHIKRADELPKWTHLHDTAVGSRPLPTAQKPSSNPLPPLQN